MLYAYTYILLYIHAVSCIHTVIHAYYYTYPGQYDIICNHMGTETVLRALNWAHGAEWTRTYVSMHGYMNSYIIILTTHLVEYVYIYCISVHM